MHRYFIFIAVIVACNITFVYMGGLSYMSRWIESVSEPVQYTDPVLVDVFMFTLEEEVRKKVGQPIDGYEPSMFLSVFPGLAETDFEGVEASIGYYTLEQGRLVHKLDESQLIHSAAKAMTRRGMETLLNNIAARTNIDLRTTGTITDIMSVLIRL